MAEGGVVVVARLRSHQVSHLSIEHPHIAGRTRYLPAQLVKRSRHSRFSCCWWRKTNALSQELRLGHSSSLSRFPKWTRKKRDTCCQRRAAFHAKRRVSRRASDCKCAL